MNRIREVLKEQGRSQKWLAAQIGKSTVMVTNYCTNKSQPKLELLYRIAELLQVSAKDLLVDKIDHNERK